MPIAILGTGRSGTSMVARMLNLCGLYLGEPEDLCDPTLNPAMNPTGYWEHREIHRLMDRLFENLGGTWENPPPLKEGWEDTVQVQPYLAEAREIVARLCDGHEEWGWKLPKATVTIAFWRRAVPGLKFVLCVRNPLDFAQSLGIHTANSRSHLFAMWQYYNYSFLAATKPHERYLTFYEHYFPCYRAALAPLLNFADLPPLMPGGQVAQDISRFYDRGLQHHASSLEDLLTDEEVPFVTRQLYLEMLSGDAHARSLPLVGYQEMLLPLLQRALVGEGVLDGSGAVSMSQHEAVKRERDALKAARRAARKRWHKWLVWPFRKLSLTQT